MENPFWQALNVIADMMLLNLLTLLCCVPVITAGAALTAMNDMVIRIVRQEENGILKGYGRAFRQNLKNGILFGLILLAAAGLLYFDYLCALTYAPIFRHAEECGGSGGGILPTDPRDDLFYDGFLAVVHPLLAVRNAGSVPVWVLTALLCLRPADAEDVYAAGRREE